MPSMESTMVPLGLSAIPHVTPSSVPVPAPLSLLLMLCAPLCTLCLFSVRMWPTGTVGENLYWLAEPVRYGWRSQPVRSRHAMRSANQPSVPVLAPTVVPVLARTVAVLANRTGWRRQPYRLAQSRAGRPVRLALHRSARRVEQCYSLCRLLSKYYRLTTWSARKN